MALSLCSTATSNASFFRYRNAIYCKIMVIACAADLTDYWHMGNQPYGLQIFFNLGNRRLPASLWHPVRLLFSSLTAVHCFEDSYMGKHPVAWEEYYADYWLKELQESMNRSLAAAI